jgi:enoyl-[acyl-carrier protein] reductase I
VLLEGRRALVYGVANHRSFAWHIANALGREGARLCLAYQGERLERNVRELGATVPGTLFASCDVMRDDEIQAATRIAAEGMGGLDILIHAVAFAKKEELAGRYLDTSRDGYQLAQDVSAYSLAAITQPAAPVMEAGGGGSIITLTYMGSERAVPNYNVMGVAKAALEASVRYLARDLGPQNIRVNAISAGPVSTLAARGVSGFTDILDIVAERSALRRNIDQDEVADTAVFLASHWSRGITGEVIHVDAGFSVMG